MPGRDGGEQDWWWVGGDGGTRGVGDWGMSGGLFQLAGTRFDCSYSSRGRVMGRKKECVLYFFFLKTHITHKMLSACLCSCWAQIAQIIYLGSWGRKLFLSELFRMGAKCKETILKAEVAKKANNNK